MKMLCEDINYCLEVRNLYLQIYPHLMNLTLGADADPGFSVISYTAEIKSEVDAIYKQMYNKQDPALARFESRLGEWQPLCQALLRIPHLMEACPDLATTTHCALAAGTDGSQSTADMRGLFKPPNLWLMAVISLFTELYHFADLKLNLKFEIEVWCKGLNIDLDNVEDTTILRNKSTGNEAPPAGGDERV